MLFIENEMLKHKYFDKKNTVPDNHKVLRKYNNFSAVYGNFFKKKIHKWYAGGMLTES